MPFCIAPWWHLSGILECCIENRWVCAIDIDYEIMYGRHFVFHRGGICQESWNAVLKTGGCAP